MRGAQAEDDSSLSDCDSLRNDESFKVEELKEAQMGFVNCLGWLYDSLRTIVGLFENLEIGSLDE